MTRAHALGVLAARALREGVLVEYIVGDLLACSVRMYGQDALNVSVQGEPGEGHSFKAVASRRQDGSQSAWVYDV